jgi:Na+/H+-dicarboxylate symporter
MLTSVKNVAIAAGLIVGLGFGLLASVTESPPLLAVASGFAPVGTAFVNLIKVVVVPLVATLLFTGVATLGDLRKLGRLGGLTLLFFWTTTLIGIAIGMAFTAAALPLAGPAGSVQATGQVVAPELPGIVDFLVSLIPSNVLQVAAAGDLLPLMVFTVLFGAAAGVLPIEERRRLLDVSEAITKALITLVHWVLWTAPLGVFALAASVTAETGLGMLRSLAVFVLVVCVGLVFLVAVVFLPAVHFWGRMSVLKFLRANMATVPIAFSTTSSAATLPAMYEAAEEGLGISRTVTSFVIPAGAAINRPGSALFQGSAIVFLAHLYGVNLGLEGFVGAFLATFLVAMTVAGVPSASIMTLPPALAAAGVPLDGLGILLGVDRIPDMVRTAVNVTGHMAACAVLERKFEGAAETRGHARE